MHYTRTIHRYSGGWSWLLGIDDGAKIGTEIAGWAFTKWGAKRSLRRAQRRHESQRNSVETW